MSEDLMDATQMSQKQPHEETGLTQEILDNVRSIFFESGAPPDVCPLCKQPVFVIQRDYSLNPQTGIAPCLDCLGKNSL